LLLFLVKKHVNHIFGSEDVSFQGISSIHSRLYSLLLFGSLDYFLFNGALGNETEDRYGLSLANTVRPVLCLGINGGIPIVVIEYYCVCGCQVHTETTCTGTEQKGKDSRVLLELLNHESSVLEIG
jgi:hypothetical protein